MYNVSMRGDRALFYQSLSVAGEEFDHDRCMQAISIEGFWKGRRLLTTSSQNSTVSIVVNTCHSRTSGEVHGTEPDGAVARTSSHHCNADPDVESVVQSSFVLMPVQRMQKGSGRSGKHIFKSNYQPLFPLKQEERESESGAFRVNSVIVWDCNTIPSFDEGTSHSRNFCERDKAYTTTGEPINSDTTRHEILRPESAIAPFSRRQKTNRTKASEEETPR